MIELKLLFLCYFSLIMPIGYKGFFNLFYHFNTKKIDILLFISKKILLFVKQLTVSFFAVKLMRFFTTNEKIKLIIVKKSKCRKLTHFF